MLAGCKSPFNCLLNDDGALNQLAAEKDPVLKKIMTEGYTWSVISYRAEEIWPALPDFLQRALNAGNSIAADSSELEIMASMAHFAQAQASVGSDIDWQQCADAACAGQPACAPYAHVLMKFCKLFGGGSDAPIVHALDAFAKKHSQHLILGDEFWTAVTDLDLGEASPCPWFRAALVACNITSAKVVDGIAKLLTKADVQKMNTKEKLKLVLDLERDLDAADKLMTKLVNLGALASIDEVVDILWLYMIRAVAFLVGKGKQTFLKTVYTSLSEINKLFFDELSAKVPAAKKHFQPTVQPKSSIPKPTQGIVSYDTLASPEHIHSGPERL